MFFLDIFHGDIFPIFLAYLQALKLREETDKEEEKEKQLVYECIKELGESSNYILNAIFRLIVEYQQWRL